MSQKNNRSYVKQSRDGAWIDGGPESSSNQAQTPVAENDQTIVTGFQKLPYEIRLEIFENTICQTFAIIESSWPIKHFKKEIHVPSSADYLESLGKIFLQSEINTTHSVTVRSLLSQQSIQTAIKQLDENTIYFLPSEVNSKIFKQTLFDRTDSDSYTQYRYQGAERVHALAFYVPIDLQDEKKLMSYSFNYPTSINSNLDEFLRFIQRFPNLKSLYICLEPPSSQPQSQQPDAGSGKARLGFVKGTTGLFSARDSSGSTSSTALQDPQDLRRISALFSHAGRIRNKLRALLKAQGTGSLGYYLKDTEIEIVQWGKGGKWLKLPGL